MKAEVALSLPLIERALAKFTELMAVSIENNEFPSDTDLYNFLTFFVENKELVTRRPELISPLVEGIELLVAEGTISKSEATDAFIKAFETVLESPDAEATNDSNLSV